METWTVSGRIEVRHGLPELRRNLGTASAIAGARVHVSGRKKIAGTWANWGPFGDAVTDAGGHFRVRKRRDRLPRQFRVEVTLKDDAFVVYGENKNALSRILAGWTVLGQAPGAAVIEGLLSHTGRATLKAAEHEAYRDPKSTSRRPGHHELGTMALRSKIERAHGDAWVLFHRVHEFLRAHKVPFRRRVGLKYPHDNHLIGDRIENSYTNPFNKVCYMVANSRKDEFDTRTLLHELMHAWAFQNSIGEWKMAWQILVPGSDNAGRFVRTFPPFHEAFARWAGLWLERSVLEVGAPPPGRPRSRQGLKDEGIDTVNEVEHFHDGWSSVFNLLTTPELDRYDFNTRGAFAVPTGAERCRAPDVSFVSVLRSFCANERRDLGWMRARDMKLRPFLRRLAASDSRFSTEHAEAYRQLQNPRSTKQPWQLLC